MYSSPNLKPIYCSMSGSNCCFLICIQVSQEASQVVWYSHLFNNFPQFVMIHTIKGSGVVNKAEVDLLFIYFFLEFSCYFCDPTDVAILISGFSAFSKPRLYIQKFSVHVLLKPSLKDFEHYLASMWNECNFAIVWTFHGIALLWDGMRTDSPVLLPLLSFPNLLWETVHIIRDKEYVCVCVWYIICT